MKSSVVLPASKSISNRVLIINALCDNKLQIANLSDADDTLILQKALNSQESIINVEGSGTAFRFLTAYFAATTQVEKILMGNKRMLQRPVDELVRAINTMGGKIHFLGENGFPPLQIFPSHMTGGKIEIKATVSSQFASALLLVAPVLKNGLKLILQGEVISESYIEMTLKILEIFGISYFKNNNCIEISPQEFIPANFFVENDWTSASYFYQVLSVAGKGEIFFPNLTTQSFQGDSIISEIFENLGVNTQNYRNGIKIFATNQNVDYLDINLKNNPDIIQTLAVACCLKKIPFSFFGIKNLQIKETDRIAALIAECKKIGCVLVYKENEDTLNWNGQKVDIQHNIKISTYGDHRMAMSFASAAVKFPIEIENPNVVTKSFPLFWNEFYKCIGTHPSINKCDKQENTFETRQKDAATF
ncbi:MAG: 3-phosphoshikimate 1-carboxyvinyltransferase [Paludibacter sp.]|nr:3-phosphoshikimate 1-carboxyvinyltransferase [Paludibacter sp.]